MQQTQEREWWYRNGDSQVEGPVTRARLESLVTLGIIAPASMVRKGAGAWSSARSFFTLEAIFRAKGLVESSAATESPPGNPDRPRALLWEWAPAIECPPSGLGVPVVNVPRGSAHVVRAISEICAVWIHGDARGTSPCLGDGCKYCPGRRDRAGYLDVLALRPNVRSGEPEVYRAVQSLPPGVLRQLSEGELVAGALLRLHWKKQGSPTELRILQGSSPYPLPEPLDLRKFLLRLWRLESWPEQEAKEPNPHILKFRRA